jgi:hypothetical protein
MPSHPAARTGASGRCGKATVLPWGLQADPREGRLSHVIAVLKVVENQRFESRLVRRLVGHSGLSKALVLFAIGGASSSEV